MPWSRLKQVKVRVNYCLDRIIDRCNLVLADVHRIRWRPLRNVVHRAARLVGDACWCLRDYPRMSAYRASGPRWTIVFVGSAQGFAQACRMFYPDGDAECVEAGRVPVWRLGAEAQRWFVGAHLVIGELSRLWSHAWKAPIAFTSPTWVHQVVPVQADVDDMLAGPDRKEMRNRVGRARRAGFSWRFSQSDSDFNEFYHRMYVPYVSARHGELALVSPKTAQRTQWFKRGGLVLATQGPRAVGGALIHMPFDVCHLIEAGVLDDDRLLRRQEINAFLFSSVIAWGREHGAAECNLGGSRAHCANGSFRFKSEWGARVVRTKRIHAVWRFLARTDLPKPLADHVNAAGFISEVGGRFYRVCLGRKAQSPGRADYERELASAARDGLSGVVVVSPGRQDVFDISR